MLVALLVCLIPTTIGGLLSAIGIAGMDRLVQRNVLAMSGRAVEAAGDVDTLLLDKTGTDHLRQPPGHRAACRCHGVDVDELRRRAPAVSSLADETPEGRSIVDAGEGELRPAADADVRRTPTLVPFTAQTRMSGVDLPTAASVARRRRRLRPVRRVADARRRRARRARPSSSTASSTEGGTPLVVAEPTGARGSLGVIHLKDVVKTGHERALRPAAGDGHHAR